MSPRSRRHVIVGHANTIHDTAMCIVEGERVYAEALERHTQGKRGWEANLYYSTRPIITALSELGLWPIKDANVSSISTWDFNSIDQQHNVSESAAPFYRRLVRCVSDEWFFE